MRRPRNTRSLRDLPDRGKYFDDDPGFDGSRPSRFGRPTLLLAAGLALVIVGWAVAIIFFEQADLAVTAVLGEGSVFSFELEGVAEAGGRTAVIRLLLVDDHASYRTPLAIMLNREPDLEVVAQAGSLGEARDALLELGDAVDVALLDLYLPDGSGRELIADLRAANPPALALVLTASSPRDEYAAHAIGAGASAVLNKASEVDEIVDAVRRLHSGEQLMPPGTVLEMVRIAVRKRGQDRDARIALERLTPRELGVLRELAKGSNDKEIAHNLHVSSGTVRNHISSILTKLGVESRLQALVFALRHGVVRVE